MATLGSMGVIELQGHLLSRADSLRGYVATKIPPPLGNLLSAEDVLQETFVAAFQNIGSFVPNGPDALDRWLITIANRKLIDALKRAHRIKRGGLGPVQPGQPRRSSSLAGLLAQFGAAPADPRERRRAQAELLLERHGIVTREMVTAEGVAGGA